MNYVVMFSRSLLIRRLKWPYLVASVSLLFLLAAKEALGSEKMQEDVKHGTER
jgi:uncharacterized membrane protein